MQKAFMLFLIVPWIAFQAACDGDAKVETGGAAPTATVAVKSTEVTIGTGGVDGVYYAVGGAMAEMVNKKQAVHGVHCTVESTGGAVSNVNAVLAGDLQFGLVQSDQSHQAVKGVGHWKSRGAQKDLRSVIGLPLDPVPPTTPAGDANVTGIPSDPGAPKDPDAGHFVGMTTLITSAKVPEQIVYNFTKAVCENLAKLKDLHPAFVGLTPKRMLEEPSAPIHPGALKYYKEAGLM